MANWKHAMTIYFPILWTIYSKNHKLNDFNHKTALKSQKHIQVIWKTKINHSHSKNFDYQELKRHKLIYYGEKSYKCYTCESVFKESGSMTRHKLNQPFFTTSKSLTRHKSIHTGEKTLKCGICESALNHSGVLNS